MQQTRITINTNRIIRIQYYKSKPIHFVYVPILAMGIPHCKVITVVSTAACTEGKWQTAETVCNGKQEYKDTASSGLRTLLQ